MESKCAICGEPLAPKAVNPFHPLCSKRCRLVDLGRWLGGDYAIPDETPTNDFGSETLGQDFEELP